MSFSFAIFHQVCLTLYLHPTGKRVIVSKHFVWKKASSKTYQRLQKQKPSNLQSQTLLVKWYQQARFLKVAEFPKLALIHGILLSLLI